MLKMGAFLLEEDKDCNCITTRDVHKYSHCQPAEGAYTLYL